MNLQLGLIGNPIKHSLSPWIHHQFMKTLGVAGEYKLYETNRDNLTDTIKKLKRIPLDGFNVTVPYKQEVIPFLDELDPDAEKIGAVNTVVNYDGKWKGYNTDGAGYVRSVKDSYPAVFKQGNRALLLGAGGAARGIYRALVQESFATVDIANRSVDKAQSLLPLKEDKTATQIMSYKEAEERLNDYQFIIQTTSVGMKPHVTDQIISLENLAPNTVVSDIVYQPLMTSILSDAKKKKGLIHQGHAMLLYQAQLAFQIWTGKNVPLKNLLQQLEERLRGNN